MNELLANPAFVRALSRKDVQVHARELGLKTVGKTQDVATAVIEEAQRRLSLPLEGLEDWSLVADEHLARSAVAPAQGSMRARVRSGLGSIRNLTGSRSAYKGNTEEDEAPQIRLVSPRIRHMASNDSIMRDLEATAPPQLPEVAPMSPAFTFGSPTQASPSQNDFAQATARVLQELETRTGAPLSFAKPLSGGTSLEVKQGANNDKGKQRAQGALGVKSKFDAIHERQFARMDSITNHPSARRGASLGKVINALAADQAVPPVPSLPESLRVPNMNGKRAASASSLSSLVGPTVKRLRVASEALAQPTAMDARIAMGLREEGFAGMPPTDEQKAMEAQRRERQQSRVNGGRPGSSRPGPQKGSPAKRLIHKTAEHLRSFGTAPPPPVLAAKPLPPVPQSTFGQATAARAASRSLRAVSGPSRIPLSGRMSDAANTVGHGAKSRQGGPCAPGIFSFSRSDCPVKELFSDENDATSLRSVSGITLKPKDPVASPRISRSEIQARVQARKQDAAIKTAVSHLSGPLKQHGSPGSSPNGKVRSSIARAGRA